MGNLHIEATKCTPEIIGKEEGTLEIKGNCFPENSKKRTLPKGKI